MKVRTFIISTLMCMTTILSAQAQSTVEQFAQPYPAGQAMKDNPNFTGQAYLYPLTRVEGLNVPMANVTFEPGCRNRWHTHTGGQILVATAGVGFYQEKGKPARKLFPGDIVEIAPGVEHWHGAAPDHWFAHIAITCNPATNKVAWLSPVDDASYAEATSGNAAPAAAQALDKRQQAIVGIAACTGRGELAGLKDALAQGLAAGMTVNEIKEVLIHAYAYCGFPRSLRAIQTFMEVLDARKAQGIQDKEGREAAPVGDSRDKYARGREILSRLNGLPQDAPPAGYAVFAPTIEQFLKEHLFCDIFERDLLTYTERELATVAILAGVGGVEPMARGHIGICLHLGLTPAQLQAAFSVVEARLGKAVADPVRQVLQELTKEKQGGE